MILLAIYLILIFTYKHHNANNDHIALILVIGLGELLIELIVLANRLGKI